MIHLVDDDLAVTNSCAFLLECMGYCVRSWNRSEDFLQNAPLFEHGIALLDMRMPGMDGHELFQTMRKKNSTLAVIFLTGHGDVPMAVKEMQLGAVNFLQKPVAAEALKAAIFAGYEHTKTLNQAYSLQCRFQRLTPKEKNVAQYIVAGMMNKDIALRMNIALRTVEVHRSKVMEKMEAKTMAELIYQLNKIPVTDSVP